LLSQIVVVGHFLKELKATAAFQSERSEMGIGNFPLWAVGAIRELLPRRHEMTIDVTSLVRGLGRKQ
jgi:hypothetical protein